MSLKKCKVSQACRAQVKSGAFVGNMDTLASREGLAHGRSSAPFNPTFSDSFQGVGLCAGPLGMEPA